jgi:transposase-like protein
MPRTSSLTEEQRQGAVGLFEAGCGRDSVATQLGVPASTLRSLYDRWRIRGAAVLEPMPARTYAFELKCAVVQRHEAGESKVTLAQDYQLSSPSLIDTWLRTYRREGLDGLRPNPTGRPARAEAGQPVSELEQLRAENERLRAEVASLGKLQALIAAERR